MSATVGGNELQFASLGKKLSLAREARGLTIEQIAKTTRIRAQMLRHLEDDEFTHFSHPSYLRLYLMDYARFLGVPLQEIRDWLPDAGTPGSENYEYITGLGADDAGQVRKEYYYPRGKSSFGWQQAVRVVLVLAVLGLVVSVYGLVRDLVRVSAANPGGDEAAKIEQPAAVASVSDAPAKPTEVPVESSDSKDVAFLLTPTDSETTLGAAPQVPSTEVAPSSQTSASTFDQQANLSLSNPPAATSASGAQIQ